MPLQSALRYLSLIIACFCIPHISFAAMAPLDKGKTGSHLHAAPGMPAEALDEADTDAPDFSEMLSGNWAGYRTKLYNAGFDFGIAYTGDYLNNVKGGTRRGGGYLDNLDLQLTLDGEKLANVKGSKLFVYFINNSGSSFNDSHVGSGEGISSIEVADPTFKLFEAWAEQNLWDDALSVRLGLYDLNSEFNVTDSSGIFLHPSTGNDTAFAVTGLNGPSAFPTTSLAGRIRVKPTEKNLYPVCCT